MNFLQRIFGAKNQGSWDEIMRAWMAGEDVISGRVPVDGTTALKYSAVFACCRVLAETFASVPLHEYKRRRDGGRDRSWDTGAYDIVSSAPNDEMDSYNLAEMMVYQLNLGGNFVAFVSRNSYGEPLSIHPYDYSQVDIYRDETTKRITYKIDRDAEKHRPDIFHVVGLSHNGVVGMSPITYIAEAIKLGLRYESIGNEFYKNGVQSTGMFALPVGRTLKEDAYKRFRESLKQTYVTAKGTPVIGEDGMTFTPFTVNFAEAQLLESKHFQVEDVCRAFRVQPHMIQDLRRSTNNNIEHQSLEFVMYTMLPIFRRIEKAINAQLLPVAARKEGYFLEYNLAGLLRGDQKSMAEAFAVGRQWGWLSVNDIRRLTNQNPIPNGDLYLEPMNMREAGTAPEEKQKESIAKEVANIIRGGEHAAVV